MVISCLYLYYTLLILSCFYLGFLGIWEAFCIAGVALAGIQRAGWVDGA
jgi:hypothetical protein